MPEDSFCANCGARYDPAQAAAAVTWPPAGVPAADGPAPMAAPRYGQQDGYGQPPGYGQQHGSPWQAPGQPGFGPAAPPRAAAFSPAVQQPGYGAGGYGMPAPAFGVPQAAAVCANCGQPPTGGQACGYCGQVWGLPNGIVLSSAARRFGGYLLEGLLILCTLVIGWIIWTLVVWAQGQTPAKQILGMRVVRLDKRTYAGWGRMFLRDFVGKLIVGVVASLIPFIGNVIASCWLLWDKDRQELWDKIAGTVVVNDPQRRLLPPARVG